MFKKGDKVELVGVENESPFTESDIGKTGIITNYKDKDEIGEYVEVDFGTGDEWCIYVKNLNKLKLTKSDLKNGDIVTYRNGQKRTVIDNHLISQFGNTTRRLSEYQENLKCASNKESDIVKVERPIYQEIWKREEREILELTKEEMFKILKEKHPDKEIKIVEN